MVIAKKTIVPKVASSPLDWTIFRHDNAHTGYSSENLKLPLELTWKYITTPKAGIPSSPAVSAGVAYFCSDGRLYALNSDTGEMLWIYPSDRRLTGEIRTSPLVGDELVYFGAGDGKLYAIRKEDGQQAWNFVAGAALNSSPVIENGILYFGSASARLYALDARTGKPKWPGGFHTPDAIETSPAISNGMIYFVSRDMVLWCALADTGKVKWTERIGPPTPASTPVVAGGTVYLAVGSTLQAFQAQTGHVTWAVNLPDEITTAPAVADDGIYFACKDGYLYGISTNGKKKWKKQVEIGVSYAKSTNPERVLVYSYASPVVAGNTVFLAGNKGTLLAADAETGEVKWRYEVSPSRLGTTKMSSVDISASPVVSNGALYIFADDGTLMSFRPNVTNYTKPEITKLYPPRDAVLPGAPPFFIQATLGDSGSGIDPKSITMSLDDVPVEYKILAGRGIVSYSTPVTETVDPLPDGRHTASVSVSDWLGNKTTVKWSFTVDNRITEVQQAAGTEGQTGQGAGRGPGMGGMRGMGGMGGGH
jgi:outer membrane protein assembly factor BamB